MWITAKISLDTARQIRVFAIFVGLLLLVSHASSAFAATASAPMQDLANEADTAYKEGDYDQAVSLYTNILETGQSSGQLYYNLGNALYKSGRLGQSILMYERAACLLPHDPDVRHNLEFARERTVDRIDPPPRLFIWSWVDAIRDMIAPDTIATLAWISAVLLAISIALVMNLRGTNLTSILRGFSWVMAVLLVLNLSLIGLRAQADANQSTAIILTDKIEVRSAPDHTSKEVFALHEGTRVDVVQVLENWAEIRLADGRQGWVPNSMFEII